MIRSYEEYQFYLKQDRIALGIRQEGWTGKLKQWLLPDPIWKFERLMRRCEYLTNCGGKRNPMLLWYRVRYRKLSLKLGFSIPINTFGPGLSIVHYGTIVVNSAARIGKNCRLHACVNIGASRGSKMAAQIGDNVYIGPSVVTCATSPRRSSLRPSYCWPSSSPCRLRAASRDGCSSNSPSRSPCRW